MGVSNIQDNIFLFTLRCRVHINSNRIPNLPIVAILDIFHFTPKSYSLLYSKTVHKLSDLAHEVLPRLTRFYEKSLRVATLVGGNNM